MRLPSVLASVGVVEEAAEEFARQSGFDDDTAGQVAMVAREACVNAVLHGNGSDPSRHVTATMERHGEWMQITIGDEGSGFDAGAVQDPLAPENLLRSSGRGIFLMRSYMDEVHFRQSASGQETVLVKRRPQLTE